MTHTPSTAPAATWHLSGFGDEIDADPRVQCAVLLALGARHIEVRSAWDTNILDLDAAQVRDIRAIVTDFDMDVSALASPIGKSDISAPVEDELVRLDRALEYAGILDTRYIRMFSFWQPEGRPVSEMRDEVINRLQLFADRAASAGVVLLHENEKRIYGDTPERVLDLVTAVDSPNLRLAWDNANFVQVGVRPFHDGFAALAPYIEYFQVKDASSETDREVVAGAGAGEIPETVAALRDRGYAGFASLEPHLWTAEELGGFTGPADYGAAARAFRRIAEDAGIRLI